MTVYGFIGSKNLGGVKLSWAYGLLGYSYAHFYVRIKIINVKYEHIWTYIKKVEWVAQ